jgi:hypothetical protein
MLRQTWQLWCELNGHEPGSAQKFSENLYAGAPEVKRVNRGARGNREYRFEAITLSENGISHMQEKGYNITGLFA